MNLFLKRIAIFIIIVSAHACSATRHGSGLAGKSEPSTASRSPKAEENTISAGRQINTGDVNPKTLVAFAKTLIGTPYKYGSAIKEHGFDCSGFVSYVFNHFNIAVPRVSRDFTNAGTAVALSKSKTGDLVLFTGTDTTGWIVGHMGLITENINGQVKFIHASSGRSGGVIVSGLSRYYATRLVKVNRIFNP